MFELLEDKYKMYSFDMPVHGKSRPLPGNKVLNTYRDYGDFVWAVVEALGVQKPMVIGCSMGDNIVYYIAQNYPVGAILSMQGADYTPTISASILELLNHPYVNAQHSHVEFSECLIGRACPQEARDFIMWGVAQEISVTKQGDLTQYNGFDVRDQMGKITCPVLIVHGVDDPIVTEKMVEDTMSRLTNTEKLVYRPVADYGHFLAVENPEVVAKHLNEFLSSL
ncbi:MAG: alpha/beta hydrolase [Breoghania sp.]|nr:alpha/beta hydrolase [Breoghania sp.]MDJ0931703.1 alpha/beta hydrolase [Breoghania sp.]